MDIEILKVVMPIITFLLGVLATPIVDWLRNSLQKRRNLKFLIKELKDEEKWLGQRIKKMNNSLDAVNAIDQLEPQKCGFKYVPRRTTVRFIESVLDSSYADLSSEKCSTLKSMTMQIDAINECAEKIKEISPTQEQLGELARLQKSFIYTACCLRYCMQYFTEEKRLEFIEEIGDKSAIEFQLSELKLPRDYDSLITKKSYSFTSP